VLLNEVGYTTVLFPPIQQQHASLITVSVSEIRPRQIFFTGYYLLGRYSFRYQTIADKKVIRNLL